MSENIIQQRGYNKEYDSPETQVEIRSRGIALDYSDETDGFSWPKSQFDKIEKIYAVIRQLDLRHKYQEKRKIIATFEERLNRLKNDQTSHLDFLQGYVFPGSGSSTSITDDKLEELDYTHKRDRVLNSGRSRASELIAGESRRLFSWFAIGNSQLSVLDSDWRLWDEIFPRVNIPSGGFISAAGAIIKHSGLWSPGFESNTIFESGPVDREAFSLDQQMWSRSVFASNHPLIHNFNEDMFTITHSAYTSSSE